MYNDIKYMVCVNATIVLSRANEWDSNESKITFYVRKATTGEIHQTLS